MANQQQEHVLAEAASERCVNTLSANEQQPQKQNTIRDIRTDEFPIIWLASLTHAASVIEHWHGGTFLGVNIKRTEDGWLGVLKAEWKGHKYVKFVNAESLELLFYLLGEALSGGGRDWKRDRFA